MLAYTISRRQVMYTHVNLPGMFQKLNFDCVSMTSYVVVSSGWPLSQNICILKPEGKGAIV